jgi:hypothetical protein
MKPTGANCGHRSSRGAFVGKRDGFEIGSVLPHILQASDDARTGKVKSDGSIIVEDPYGMSG